jgi:polysaccharide biosynthesis protein PslG
VLALGAVAIFTCAAEVEASSRARASVAAPLGGVNIGGLYEGATPALATREIAAAKTLHAGVVRAGISWSVTEPAGPGQISARAEAFTDRLVSAAAADHIKVILMVDSTPCWASSAPAALARRCSSSKASGANAWPPRDPSGYAAFVAYLAQRYGAQLAAIEIWNEPDQVNQAYFAGPHKVQRYAAILRAAYAAIKRANPAVPVIGGSLVGANGVFLRALYAAGIKGYYDGLAVHFYTLGLASLRAFREVQVANGDTKPLWLDEFGWSSCYPRHKVQEEQPCVTPAVQARNLADLVRSLAHTPYVASQVMYNLQDSGQERFGVLSAAGRRKAAFVPLSQALASPFGPVHPITLRLRRRGNNIVANGSGPVGDFMQLEAFAGGVLRYRASFTLNRFDDYSLTLPAVLGTSGLTVRVFQLWGGLQGAAQRSI